MAFFSREKRCDFGVASRICDHPQIARRNPIHLSLGFDVEFQYRQRNNQKFWYNSIHIAEHRIDPESYSTLEFVLMARANSSPFIQPLGLESSPFSAHEGCRVSTNSQICSSLFCNSNIIYPALFGRCLFGTLRPVGRKTELAVRFFGFPWFTMFAL